MRFPVAVLMIGLGYAFVYWSLERVFVFGPSDGSPSTRSPGMAAVPLVVLLMGNKGAAATARGSQLPPFHFGKDDPTVKPASNAPGGGGAPPATPNQGSGGLSGIGTGIGGVVGGPVKSV